MHQYITTEFNAFVFLIIYFSDISCLHSISKRYYPIPSFDSKNIPQQRSIRDSILDRFHINTNTIIRTHDSRALGAKYLNETELPSNEDCLYWCWETSPCNLAVYEEKVSHFLIKSFKCNSTDINCISRLEEVVICLIAVLVKTSGVSSLHIISTRALSCK